jgi:hypothetical protein
MDIALLIVVVVLPLWLTIRATLLVLRDSLSEKSQRIAQLLLVWLVPLIGAIVVLGVHRREEKLPGVYPGEKDAEHDWPPAGGSLRRVSEAVDGD